MNLKMVKLTNCLGIEEKEIQIGKVTMIDGASETGKTSIIDSIRKGLKNEDVRPKFVNGEGKSVVFMQFDENLEVTRTVKRDNKSTLKVTKDDMTPKGPQTYINNLLGDNDFAPIDWLKKKDKEQAEDLLRLLPIKVTPEDVEKLTGEKVNLDYDKHGLVVCEDLEKHYMEVRKEINADVKAYKINIEDYSTKLPNGYNPDKYRDVKLNDLFSKISEIENTNKLIERAKERVENSKETISNFDANYSERLKDLEEEFKRRKQELKNDHGSKVEEEKEKVQKAKDFIQANTYTDTEKLKEESREIEEGQSYLRTYDDLQEAKIEFKKWDKKSSELTELINKIRDYPGRLLDKAESPIESMGIEGGMITINGLPIKNLSDGAKMRLAITVAKATSGDLKLILLNGFEQLNWELQKEMFAEMQGDEFQYIITRVTDGPLSISHIKNNQIINTETGEAIEF